MMNPTDSAVRLLAERPNHIGLVEVILFAISGIKSPKKSKTIHGIGKRSARA